MNWIKIEVGILEKPKVITLCDITGLDEFSVVGRLVKLWSWIDTHIENCNAPTVTKAFLDRYLNHSGFANALEKVGWITSSKDENCIQFVNIEEHNGATAKSRAQANKRVERFRNAPSVTSPLQKPLPEKRREEKRRVNTLGEGIAPTDEEWLLSLSKNAAYQGIDVSREFEKMKVWCQTNRKEATRRRFTNWLNRVDKPISKAILVNHTSSGPYIPGLSR